MATRITTVVQDDYDGEDIAPGDAEKVPFTLDGDEYLLDLSTANALRFYEAVAPFVKNASPVRRAKRKRRSPVPRKELLKDMAAAPAPVIPSPAEVNLDGYEARTEPAPEPDPPLDPADPRRNLVGSNGELTDAALRRSIRKWGKARKWPGLGDKGRLPADLVAEYLAAQDAHPEAEAAAGG